MATETPNPEDRFETVSLLVEIRRRITDGAVYSSHRPLAAGDLQRLKDWPSGGLIQTSHALLMETLRREAYTSAITVMSQGTDPQELTVDKVEEVVRGHLVEMTAQFTRGVVEDVVGEIHRTTPTQEAPAEE